MAGKLLSEKLVTEQKEATKSRDKFRLSVIRMLRSELHNEEIKKQSALDEKEELTILTREVKRRKDALTDFEKSGREELVKELIEEIELLSKYLPEQLSEADLNQLIKEAIITTGAESARDIGKVLGFIMPKIQGKAEGKIVRQLVEKQLK